MAAVCPSRPGVRTFKLVSGRDRSIIAKKAVQAGTGDFARNVRR
jgi:hypothetical protein